MLRSKKFAHGVQIGKARVIELRVLLLRPPAVSYTHLTLPTTNFV